MWPRSSTWCLKSACPLGGDHCPTGWERKVLLGITGMGDRDGGVSQLKPCHAFGKLEPHPRTEVVTSPPAQFPRVPPPRVPVTWSPSRPLWVWRGAGRLCLPRAAPEASRMKGFYCSFGQTGQPGTGTLGNARRSACSSPSRPHPAAGGRQPWNPDPAGAGKGESALQLRSGRTRCPAPLSPLAGGASRGRGWAEPGPWSGRGAQSE